MIRNTFQHIPGFSALKEKQLWNEKILNWDDYERKVDIQLTFGFDQVQNLLDASKHNYSKKDVDFFTKNLHPHEFYRVAHSFPDKTIFLDIETTGLSRYYNTITIVGWSILGTYKVHIDGDEKSKMELQQDLENCNCIVTFNGSIFDLPFLKMLIPKAKIPLCHIDLRFFSRRVGLQGGQKMVEEQLDFKRPFDLKDIDGHEATILWHKYKEGDINSLKQLIRYNAHDIDGMKLIFEQVTGMLLLKEESVISKSDVFPFSKYGSKVVFTENEKSKEKIYLPTFSGKSGPIMFLDDLEALKDQSIVGIDLTGSEAKASGWAYLEKETVVTKTILSNEELIAETIKMKPSLISIDSPLSIPAGRTTVFDSDPFREQFGITRECERTMAKRGVKSYPCLIQSMQKLTQRGIFLANEFRKLGYPVIESYPGAAQDILGIPRKGKSLEYLIKGLKAFGIKGKYDNPDVTHDEIDAITSALVGYFFFAGKYEALGNEKEDYLIIPCLKDNPNNSNQFVIGFSGYLSAGKTTAGKLLQQMGFCYGRYSMVITSYLEAENKSISRTNQQELGEFINKEKGQRWLGTELMKLLTHNDRIVIDGLRFPEDHAFLKERFGRNFLHIHLTSDKEIRKARYLSRNINDKDFDEAQKHNVEASINKLEKLADIKIENNGSISDLIELAKSAIIERLNYSFG